MHALPEHITGPDIIDDRETGIRTTRPAHIGMIKNLSIDVGTYDAGMLVAEVAAYVRLRDQDRALHLDVSLPDLPIMINGNMQIIRLALRSIASAAARCAGRKRVLFHMGVRGDKIEFAVTGSARPFEDEDLPAGAPAAPIRSPHQEHPALSHVMQQARSMGGAFSVTHDENRGCRYLLTIPLGCQEQRRYRCQ
jgi:hypothetical protein